MQVAEVKKSSSASPNVQAKRQPFFSKEGEGSFFSKSNEATTSFFSPATIQPKLTIGQPNDKYEVEADTMADKVVQRLSKSSHQNSSADMAGTSNIQRKCSSCEEEEKRLHKKEEVLSPKGAAVQRRPIFESHVELPEEQVKLKRLNSPIVQAKCSDCEKENVQKKENGASKIDGIDLGDPHDIYEREADVIAKKITNQDYRPSLQKKETEESVDTDYNSLNTNSLTSGGSKLPGTVQAFFEDKMGYDFNDVKIHTGVEAVQKSQALNAHAFTYGNHIWLNADQKVEPSFIMAHEMAHVVQQTRPKVMAYPTSRPLLRKGNENLGAKKIQRFIFWNEYKGGITNRSGQETHNEIENALDSSDIKTEIGVPTGNINGIGFGFDGRADLYKGKPVGVTFKKGGATVCPNGEEMGNPVGLNTKKKDRQPRLGTTNKIINIDKAPTDIKVGDIKPANEEVVNAGKKQVDNYRGGLEFTKNRVNCWSDLNPSSGNSPQWNLTPGNFDSSSLSIPGDYAPGAGSTRQLGISDFNMVSDQARLRPKTEKILSPHNLGINIDGKLVALHAGGGVIAYAYVPVDYNAVIDALSLRKNSKELTAYAEFATTLQNKVILPLLTAPKKPKGKVKKTKQKTTSPNLSKIKGNRLTLQRKPKPKLEDNFKLGDWKKEHLQHQNNFRTKNKGTKDKLQFLELMYKVDANLSKAGVTVPGGKLPKKDKFDIELGKSPKRKPQEKNLTSLYSWMNIWSKEPMKFIGTLRDKFGSTFVKVANKFVAIKDKIDQKLKKAEKNNSPKGKSYGQIAVRAFWKALLRIGGVVLEDTIKLMVESLESGLKKKMNQIIPLNTEDLEKELENGFPELKKIKQTIDRLESDIEKKMDEVVNKFDEEIEALKNAAEKAKTLGKIIKWAMIALQCASPPGWGCLKLLAQRLIAELIDEIMSWCGTKKKFNEAVLTTGMFDEMPKRIATNLADVIEGSVPGLSPLFDRKVFELSKRPNPDKIPCEEEIPTELQKEMVLLEITLKNRLGDEGYLLFVEAVEKYGVTSTEEITVDMIREIKQKVPNGVTPEELRMFIASNPRPKPGNRVIMDVADFLERVKEAGKREDLSWYHIVHPPAKGHTKFPGNRYNVDVSISPQQPSSHWTIIKQFQMPATVTNRVWDDSSNKLFRIEYRALQNVEFDLYENEKVKISDGEFMKGYRPDPFK